MFPPGLLFGLGLLSPEKRGQIFPKWPPLEELMLRISPQNFASSVSPLQRVIPFSQEILQESYRVSAVPWDPVHMKAFEEWSLYFPQSHGAPAHKPHCPSMPNALGVLPPTARSQTWEPDVGLGTLTPMGEPL